jgi:eukaryotic-like serine/threonine-protein kinase
VIAVAPGGHENMQSGNVVAGKYRLNQLLGSGGMAEVWSATNTFTDRQIAIKFMSPAVAKTPEAAARFLKEAKVSARVNHPNVIDVHDVGQTEQGQLFLVMELLTGFPLEVALRRQNPPMTIYEFALVMVEVGGALAAAHRSGIVHRDLKPTNIFLHRLWGGVAIPKLLDFGVSKFLEDDQNHALTIAGTVLGSPLYMSPEQARGESTLDGRTDVFAFGAILFEALCGVRPYDAKNFNALIVKIATTRPKSIDEHAPYAPESLRAVVRGCLEPDLKKRIQTFEEIVRLLKAAMNELEFDPARLPTPMIATAVVDPDATNALPMMRASDRPPAVMGQDTIPSHPPAALSLSGSIPPASSGPTGPSWHTSTPNTSYASIHVPAPKPSKTPWIVAGAALALSGMLAIGLVAATRSSTGTAAATAAVTAPDPLPSATSPASAASSDDTPTMSVDALPQASSKAASGPIVKGYGRLFVQASPGWCTVSVDGKERGPTPIAALDIVAGPHTVTCKTPAGKTRSMVVHVVDGQPSKQKFSLNE